MDAGHVLHLDPRHPAPRFRYDQLMSFGWKILLPLATLNVLVTAILVVVTHEHPSRRDQGRLPRSRTGGMGGAYRAFGETLRGLRTTMGRLFEKPVTIQYPEEKTPVCPRFRGRHKLHKFEDSGFREMRRLLALRRRLPGRGIKVVAAENDPREPGLRWRALRLGLRDQPRPLHLLRLLRDGLPFDAITMGHDYEMADYNRSDPIFTKEMLLAEPIERTPLRERASGGRDRLLHRRDRRPGAAIAVIAVRNPFYSVLAWSSTRSPWPGSSCS